MRGSLRSAWALFATLVVACTAAAGGVGADATVADTVALASVRADAAEVEILAHSFDLTEHGHGGFYDVVLYPGDRARLDRMGFDYEVVIPDLVASSRADRAAEALAQASEPSERLTYRTLADHEADLDRLAERAPDIARVFTLPHRTYEGRHVRGIEIATDVTDAATDGRPSVLIDGLHHAREWPSGELTIMFAEDLVDRALAGDPEIVDLLSRVRVLLVPVVNPDGFVRSRETASDWVAPLPGAAALAGEYAYHRKNVRPKSPGSIPVGVGIDDNRNYPYLWGGDGASSSPTSQTYFGPGPGSEPEVANIRSLVLSNNVVTYATNHTYGDLILRPWGHTDEDPPDETLLVELGDRMAGHNGYRSIKGIELYPTTGTADDWVYAATSALGYTFEIGSRGLTGLGNATPAECAGFHPQYNLCVPAFYSLNRGAYLELLHAAADPATHAVVHGAAPAGTTITATKTTELPLSRLHAETATHTDIATVTITVGPEGGFTWHLNPSASPHTVDAVHDGHEPVTSLEMYTLVATTPDGRTTSKTLLAERGGSYRFDVQG